MNESESGRRLTGWQRAHVRLAAEYVRELLPAAADPARARTVYEALLDVLEPARRTGRQHREEGRPGSSGSMWDRRSARDRRVRTRRAAEAPAPAGEERRRGQRRSGRDRRTPRG